MGEGSAVAAHDCGGGLVSPPHRCPRRGPSTPLASSPNHIGPVPRRHGRARRRRSRRRPPNDDDHDDGATPLPPRRLSRQRRRDYEDDKDDEDNDDDDNDDCRPTTAPRRCVADPGGCGGDRPERRAPRRLIITVVAAAPVRGRGLTPRPPLTTMVARRLCPGRSAGAKGDTPTLAVAARDDGGG